MEKDMVVDRWEEWPRWAMRSCYEHAKGCLLHSRRGSVGRVSHALRADYRGNLRMLDRLCASRVGEVLSGAWCEDVRQMLADGDACVSVLRKSKGVDFADELAQARAVHHLPSPCPSLVTCSISSAHSPTITTSPHFCRRHVNCSRVL